MLWLGGHCCGVHLISSLGQRKEGEKEVGEERGEGRKKGGERGRKEGRKRKSERIGRKEEWRPRDSAGWIRLSV